METAEAKKGKTGRKKFRPKSLLIVLIPAVAAVAAVLIVYLATNKASEFILNGDAYQTYAGGGREFRSGSKLTHEEDGSSYIVEQSVPVDLVGLPLYFKGRNAILLPSDVVYYDARATIPRKLDYFSELGIDKDGGVHLTRTTQEKETPLGFLYDGVDMYIFLEPVTISWNGFERELDALSYAEAVLGEHIMIYDHANDKTYLEDLKGEVTVKDLSGDYSISLLYDSMTLSNGEQTLLFGRADKLDSIYD